MANEENGRKPSVRKRLAETLNEKTGQQISADDLVKELGCTKDYALQLLSQMPGMLYYLGKGQYLVRDDGFEATELVHPKIAPKTRLQPRPSSGPIAPGAERHTEPKGGGE